MKKHSSNLIAGLDIGSHAVRIAVGQHYLSENSSIPELRLLGAVEAPSEGIHKGNVSSIDDIVSSVSACLERVERTVGSPIDNVWLGVSGSYIISQTSKGVVAVSKANNEITPEDVMRVLEAARAIAVPLNYEVLHVMPKSFSVDGQSGIKDPVGMTGMRLEVDAYIALGASSQIKNLTKAVYRTGVEIEDLVLSILSVSDAVLTSKQKELGVVVVNIGAATTSLAIFEDGDILHAAVIPIGSDHITNDIAIGLRTLVDIAERVKVEFGSCISEAVSKRDDIDLFGLGASDHEIVKRSYVSEIIEARVEEIMVKIDQELNRVSRSALLPAGVVFVGSGAKLPGITEAAKKYLRLPASLGLPLNITSVSDKANDLGFATAISLVKWGATMRPNIRSSALGNSMRGGFKRIGGVSGQLKNIFRNLLP